MKNSDVLYWKSRSIEQCQPERKNHQRIEKLKETKLNKNKLIAKTLEAFKPKAKFFIALKRPITKICSKPILVSKIGAVLYLEDPKIFIGLWRSINSKMTEKNKKKKSIANYGNVAGNRDINIFRIISVSLEAIQ